MDAPPPSLRVLRELIVARRLPLTSGQQAALRYMMENPAEASFATCRSIATESGVSPGTVNQLAKRLGFSTFNDFRTLFRSSLRDAAHSGSA